MYIHILYNACYLYPLASVPTHWTKGKLLGSGAFGKVSGIRSYLTTHNYVIMNTSTYLHVLKYNEVEYIT